MPVSRRLVASSAAVVAALWLLAGCVPSPSPSASGLVPPTADPRVTPTGTNPPVPTASPSTTTVSVPCDTLISRQTIYDFNPNFGLIDSWTPAAGSPAAVAKSDKGVACRWLNQTSGDLIDLSVASLDAASLESLKNQTVGTSTMVPTYSGADEGYFSVSNGVGTAVVFDRSYWIVITSSYFAEPGDPSDLIASVLAALP